MEYFRLISGFYELTRALLGVLLVTSMLSACTFQKMEKTQEPGVVKSTYGLRLFGLGDLPEEIEREEKQDRRLSRLRSSQRQ